MKKSILPIFLLLGFIMQAQNFPDEPEGFNYQAVARQVDGTIISNQMIEMELAISRDSDGDQIVFREGHDVVTDEYGLVNVTIGKGDSIFNHLDNINWSAGNHFLQTRLTIDGEIMDLPSTQFHAVPYAKFAETTADKLWSSGEDNQAYYQNGSVGIGIEDPQRNLEVASYEGDPTIRIHARGEVDGDPAIELVKGEGFEGADWRLRNDDGILRVERATSNFTGGTSTYMAFNNSNVGIGTTEPEAPLTIRRGGSAKMKIEAFGTGPFGLVSNSMLDLGDNAGNYHQLWSARNYEFGIKKIDEEDDLDRFAMRLSPDNTFSFGSDPPLAERRMLVYGNGFDEYIRVQSTLGLFFGPRVGIEFVYGEASNSDTKDFRLVNVDGTFRMERSDDNFTNSIPETMLSVNDGNGNLNMHFHRIVDLADPNQLDHAVTLGYLLDALDNFQGEIEALGIEQTVQPAELSAVTSTNMNFVQCATYCRDLTESGLSDWTIPTAEELTHFAGENDSTFIWTSDLDGSNTRKTLRLSSATQAQKTQTQTSACRCIR